MVSLGRLVFKATGVMSNRGLMKNSRKIGATIAERMQQSPGKLETQEVEQIISDTIGKKAARKIKIFGSKDAARAYMEKQNNKAADIEQIFKEAGGVTIPENYSRRAGVYLNRSCIDELVGGNSQLASAFEVNTLAHEIQHAMTATSGKTSLPKSIGRFSFGRKRIDKLVQKARTLDLQKKYMDLQLECMKSIQKGKPVSEAEIIKNLYAKGILQVGKDKENAFILKYLKRVYEDEYRSYRVGNEAMTAFSGPIMPERIIHVNDLYRDLVKVTGKELKHARLNQVRRFFGFKPDTAREQAIVQEYEAQQAATLAEQAKTSSFAKSIMGTNRKVKAFTPTES